MSKSCATCGTVQEQLTPAGHCCDPTACTQRRIARTSKYAHLHFPCAVRVFRYGKWRWLRSFGPKMSPAPLVLPPGFTAKDYEPKPRVYYETVNDPKDASSFEVSAAITLAKHFGGQAVNKQVEGR